MKINKYLLEITVFICGAVVMIFELVGSRVLGPYFGTSIFIWTSLIGIIMGGLAAGYYFGGRIADKKASFEILSFIIFLAALAIGMSVFKDMLLSVVLDVFKDVRFGSIISSFILFLPASFLLGIISPYAVKLKMENLINSGKTVGNLYAISTVGSIFGTFLAGFYLIPNFGTNKLLLILAVILFCLSLILFSKNFFKIKLAGLFIVLFFLFRTDFLNSNALNNSLIDIDTAYSRVWIYDYTDPRTSKPAKVMGINNENHTAMFLANDELVNEYTKYYNLAKHFQPNFKKALMFGGAGYAYPKDFLAKYSEASIDVVEIDHKITELAKKYFRLKDDNRLKIYHEDGRVFLNKTKEKYDVIFGDAFGSRYSLPYQLTTKEAVQKKYNVLNDNGVIIINLISALEGEKSMFLRAEYATYKNIFPQVYLFPVANKNDGLAFQNIMLVALKSDVMPKFSSSNKDLNEYLEHIWKKEIKLDLPILTDDYAPVDYYINKAL